MRIVRIFLVCAPAELCGTSPPFILYRFSFIFISSSFMPLMKEWKRGARESRVEIKTHRLGDGTLTHTRTHTYTRSTPRMQRKAKRKDFIMETLAQCPCQRFVAY